MKAIILAAGASRRLKPFTKNIPKCCIKIGDRSIIAHQLDAIDHAGIREAVIVVGYRKEMIKKHVGASYKRISRIRYIENPDYATTNTIYSLYLTRDEFMDQDFIYFNADVLFHKSIVKLLAEHPKENVLAVDYKKCGQEEVKFLTNSENRIVEIGKSIPTDKAEGEFIGVAKFGRGISHTFIEALREHSTKGERNLFFERAVSDILEKDVFTPLDVSGIPNIEIDFPEDLEKARRHIYPLIVKFNGTPYGRSE